MPLFAATSSTRDHFTELDVGVWHWVGLLAIIGAMLAIDLYRHRDNHAPSTREALIESAVWVACGLAFAGAVALSFGSDAFGEYLSGYLIEKSLSVDNVFVWALIFATMGTPLRYQHRVLFWGIFGALVLRAGFIFAGSALIARFFWLLIVFGVFLVITGVRVLHHRDDEGEEETVRGTKLLERFIPVTDQLDGHRFLTRRNGRRVATPLLATLVVVELTDVVFAVDSVPAILAVAREPYLVFAANAFAIVGLRAMYFLLATAKDRFHYLSHGLGAILIFVGLKMSVSHWYHLNTYVSLAVIAVMLLAAIAFSELRNRSAATVA